MTDKKLFRNNYQKIHTIAIVCKSIDKNKKDFSFASE